MSRISEAIRKQVHDRAGERCEYCRKPQQYSSQRHHIDHIIALKHNGSSELDNLALVCFQCNATKGPIISSIDTESQQLTP